MILLRVVAIGLSTVFILPCNGKQEPPSQERSPGTATVRSVSRASYSSTIQSIETERERLAAAYKNAPTATERKRVLDGAAENLFPIIDNDLIPPWIGTPWDFNGITQVPGEGKIACGYFVSTVLRDAGFGVQRSRLAQQASELIIKSLVASEQIKRFSNIPLDQFITTIESWGKGLYVVGLDCHVGFIIHNDRGIHFAHSSYVPPGEVAYEVASRSSILASSRYRVLGKLSGDDKLMLKWLRGEAIQTRTP